MLFLNFFFTILWCIQYQTIVVVRFNNLVYVVLNWKRITRQMPVLFPKVWGYVPQVCHQMLKFEVILCLTWFYFWNMSCVCLELPLPLIWVSVLLSFTLESLEQALKLLSFNPSCLCCFLIRVSILTYQSFAQNLFAVL